MQRMVTKVAFLSVLIAWPLGAVAEPCAKPVVGILLSGSGIYDGSELHEAVLALAALDRNKVEVVAMAPNIEQAEVINHMTRQPVGETRNVLTEASRIVRGAIKDMKDVRAQDLDALMIVGGLGVAKNLSTFLKDGANCLVDPEVERLIKEMLVAGKPIGTVCMSPVIVARVAGQMGLRPKLTIGTNEGTANAIVAMGAEHVPSQVTDVVVDRRHKIVSNAAYMLAKSISEVAIGIDKTVHQLVGLIHVHHHHRGWEPREFE